MKHLIKFKIATILVLFIAVSSCKKEPEITKTYELSAEMMAYFVNYEVGTKWIYQDTMDVNNFDTIELISIKHFDVTDGTTLQKGYELYYKPHKSKDFKVFVSAGVNNTYYVKVDPLVSAAGKIVFENYNGNWTTGVTYYDSIEISGTKYFHVINSKSSNSYQQDMSIAKNMGIVSFWKTRGLGVLESYFKLIKIIKQ